ncbi:MAG: ATP-binding protein [Dehalococcoidia bacterium]
MTQFQDILVSTKLLGHISEGFYTSPAAAMKELISNSFDAGATRVDLTTNWPYFDIFTATDNGSGMEAADFRSLMRGGIGTSKKRVTGAPRPGYGRPTIGRLGVGVLAIGQFCHSFQFESHHSGTRTAFSATVSLTQKAPQRLDESDPNRKKFDVGKFKVERVPYDVERRGTRILSDDLKESFIRKMAASVLLDGELKPPVQRDFVAFFQDVAQSRRGLADAGEYAKLIWGLAHYAPVQYMNDGPIEGRRVAVEHKARLDAYKFEVIVDGCSLRKPVLLPSSRQTAQGGVAPRINPYSLHIDKTVLGERLEVKGYVAIQYGQAIQPPELRGLVIRVRDVAIGTYDRSLLGYPFVEGPRSEWVSGELYVVSGLEDALTAPRETFDSLHPHYEQLQDAVFSTLHNRVFPDAYKGIAERTLARREEAAAKLLIDGQTLLEEELDLKLRVARGPTRVSSVPVEIDLRRGRVTINESYSWPRARARRDVLQRVALAFEISRQLAGKAGSDQAEMFYRLLRRLV